MDPVSALVVPAVVILCVIRAKQFIADLMNQ